MTAIKINTYPSDDGEFFNEDNTVGLSRIGRKLQRSRGAIRNVSEPVIPFPISTATIAELDIERIVTLTSEFESGVRAQLADDSSEATLSFVKEGDTSTKQIKLDFGKVKQGVSIKSTFDLHADFLPYVYMQGGKTPYPHSIFQRFNPTFDEDFFGVKEKINRKNYVPFEDISVVSPGYVSSVKYLKTTDPYTNKLYPRFSGSHYTNPNELVGTLDPFEVIRSSHNIKLIDQTSSFTARRHIFGISANLMISEREEAGNGKPHSVKRGGNFIDDKREIRYNASKQVEKFDDAKSIVRLKSRVDKTIGTVESEGIYEFIPFDDIFNSLSGLSSYNFLTSKPTQHLPLTASLNTISVIGTRYISSNAGYVYESTTLGNTTLGTDSIAFGGLSRRS